ncbi:MAG: outer membrane beta-barrel protein [Bacteroidia bacterium]|nr:outer membrane beta-barrel protein [Bacteroidia bacterium]
MLLLFGIWLGIACQVNAQQSAENIAGMIPRYHQVQKGETIYSLARFYKVNQDNLVKWNRLKQYRIFAGTKIIVGYQKPGVLEQSPRVEKVVVTLHDTVVVRDTVWVIEEINIPGQNDTIFVKAKSSPFHFEAYVDVYYAQYSDRDNGSTFAAFPCIAPRSNSFGLNTFQLSAGYKTDRLRALAQLHVGDLAADSWPSDFPYLRQANIGVRIGKGIWLDAGFFPVHLGAESVPPKDNLMSTIALATFHEPFYQGGIKLSYENHPKLSASLHVVNGYNQFSNFDGHLAVGVSVGYQFNDQLKITYGNLLSDDGALSKQEHRYRLYNNLVFNWNPNDRLEALLGLNLGLQGRSQLSDSTATALMVSALATLKYHFSPHLAGMFRAETFQDRHGILSGLFTNNVGNPVGLQAWALTGGLEYKAMENQYLRLEGKYVLATPGEEIFENRFHSGAKTTHQWEIVSTLGIWFGR